MGLQSHIWSNRIRVFYLIALIPVILYAVLFGFMFYDNSGYISDAAFADYLNIAAVVTIPLILWLFILVIFQRKLIFAFSGAKPLARKSNPELYNLMENLAITQGIPTPKFGIIEDDSMNAFATGWGYKDSWVVVSRGLINRLEKDELEAVLAHELTHIYNGDVRVMVIVTCFVGIILTVGEIMVRFGGNSGSKKDNGGGQIILLGLVLLILGYLVFPLINLAISRKKEYLADAGSVQLTKNPDALARALQKISGDSTIESITKQSLANMCIANPFPKMTSSLMSKIHALFSTHPPIEDRIRILKELG